MTLKPSSIHSLGLGETPRLDAGAESMALGHACNLLERIQKSGVVELAGNAHGLGQIEMADPENVYTGRRGNLLQVVKPFHAFDLADDGRIVVGVFHKIGRIHGAGNRSGHCP